VIVITAAGGATTIITGVLLLFGGLKLDQLGPGLLVPLKQASPFWLIIWVVLAILGLIVQIGSTRDFEIELPA
jgi:hypothetical protein